MKHTYVFFSPRSSNTGINATKRRASVANSYKHYENSPAWEKDLNRTENKLLDRKHSIYNTKGSDNPSFVPDIGIIQY